MTDPKVAPSPLQLPSIATVVLGLVDGALTILVHDNFGIAQTWSAVLSTILVLLGGVGVQPLLGPAFRTALHLPFQVTVLVSAGMSAAAYYLSTNPVGLSHTLAGWITGGIAFLSAVGFGTTVARVVAASKKQKVI